MWEFVFLVRLALLVFKRHFHVLLKHRSQYLAHMMPNLSGDFFLSLRLGDGCAQFDHMDLEKKISALVVGSVKKGQSPKMTSCGPSNFEGDRLHLNLLKETLNFGSSSFAIHITYYDKVSNFLKMSGMTEMVIKQTKNQSFSVVAPWRKAMFICRSDLQNVV
jgi:hypothetical protein